MSTGPVSYLVTNPSAAMASAAVTAPGTDTEAVPSKVDSRGRKGSAALQGFALLGMPGIGDRLAGQR